eukprot:2634833-Rhodomonas_salina.1
MPVITENASYPSLAGTSLPQGWSKGKRSWGLNSGESELLPVLYKVLLVLPRGTLFAFLG